MLAHQRRRTETLRSYEEQGQAPIVCRSFADRVAAMVTLDFVLQLLLQLQPGYKQDKLS